MRDENLGTKKCDTKICQKKNGPDHGLGPDTLPGWEKLFIFNKYLFGLYQATIELWMLKSALSSDILLLKLWLLVLIHFDLQDFFI